MQLNSLHYAISKADSILFPPPESDRLHDDYLWALSLAVDAAQKPRGVIKVVGAKRNL